MVPMKEDAIGFFQYGMDRVVPDWVRCDWDRPIVNLGPGEKHIPNTIELEWPEWDGNDGELPFDDGELGGIFATHLLEHLYDPRPLIKDAQRALSVGCPFNIVVPNAGSFIMHQELDHKTPFTLDTWETLFNSSYYSKKKMSGFEIGANFTMSVKHGNEVLVTQLIKV